MGHAWLREPAGSRRRLCATLQRLICALPSDVQFEEPWFLGEQSRSEAGHLESVLQGDREDRIHLVLQ